ncbi:hypothetical protein K438DRAFT_1772219 [Mycena galopus ATCC 62051]|nr:hypothetical protein K438DRAFT_1772219 [Mycena galopus ATCC 62051]
MYIITLPKYLRFLLNFQTPGGGVGSKLNQSSLCHARDPISNPMATLRAEAHPNIWNRDYCQVIIGIGAAGAAFSPGPPARVPALTLLFLTREYCDGAENAGAADGRDEPTRRGRSLVSDVGSPCALRGRTLECEVGGRPSSMGEPVRGRISTQYAGRGKAEDRDRERMRGKGA